MLRVRFFYTLKGLAQSTWAVRNCKRPTATREYKQLKKMFNEYSIESFGYEVNWGVEALLNGEEVVKTTTTRN